jgi:hypothetical protein
MGRLLTAALLFWLIIRPAFGQNVLWEARFDQPLALRNWQANADLADLSISESTLGFRGVGPNPTLVYSAPLSIAATPFQAVEIRLKADRDGNAELFWSRTTTGPYGGFSG